MGGARGCGQYNRGSILVDSFRLIEGLPSLVVLRIRVYGDHLVRRSPRCVLGRLGSVVFGRMVLVL